MRYEASSPEDYLAQMPEDRIEAITCLREEVLENLPEGYFETLSYGMLSYAVSRDIYPQGYHANPKEPLSIISIGNQKRHIGFYYLGFDLFPEIFEWFSEEYAKRVPTKLDYGKSCVRLKNVKHMPFELFGELASKVSAPAYVEAYEKALDAAREARKNAK